jgi:thiamine biosynthesis lipoprotein
MVAKTLSGVGGLMVGRGALLGLALVVTAAAAIAHGDGPALARYEFNEPQMGTRFRIVLYAADEATARRASQAAFRRAAELNGIMSDYQPTSELMRLCAKAGGPPVPVSPDLFAVLDRSLDIARRTDGAFDVTVGPVVRLWRRARRTREMPAADQLAAARALVGYQMVTLDPKARTVRLAKPGMQLDVGGIAKGYAAEALQVVLKEHGVTRALVAAGGDIAVSGPPPDAPGWTVGVAAAPGEPTGGPTLVMHDAGVSTAGDAEQYVEINGKRYAHIIDPHTGLGLTDTWQVTVVARDDTTADGLDTGLAVLGPERGLKVVEGMEGVSARFVRKTERGVEERRSRHFPAPAREKK